MCIEAHYVSYYLSNSLIIEAQLVKCQIMSLACDQIFLPHESAAIRCLTARKGR